MPSRAIQYAGADYIPSINEIVNLLDRVHRGEEPPAKPTMRKAPMPDHIDKEVREAEMEEVPDQQPGKSSELA